MNNDPNLARLFWDGVLADLEAETITNDADEMEWHERAGLASIELNTALIDLEVLAWLEGE